MSHTVEELDRYRRRMIAAVMVALGCWQGADILKKIVQPANGSVWLGGILTAASLLGAGFFIYYQMRMLRFRRVLEKDEHTAEALNDELVQMNRLNAFRQAFFIQLIASAGLYLVTVFHPVRGEIIAQTLMTIGIVAVLGAFLLKEREQAT